MSADFKESKKHSANDRNHVYKTKMNDILARVADIDEQIKKLSRKREQLMISYEKLSDEKIVHNAEMCSDEERWNQENFPWSERMRKTMKKVFKLTDYRPQQLATMNAIMSKKDVLLIAPTGGGKSLCYQLPALLNDGLTLVISPLISLMEDQVWSLKKFGIKAEYLSSKAEKEDLLQSGNLIKQLASGSYDFKILYITPERMAKSKRFMNALQKQYLAKRLHMIAVDEVHCISQFGNDFRPDYKFLGTMKTMFPDVPILGVTATATTKVIIDIQKMLNLEEPIVLKAEFNRPNLYYQVMEKPEKEECIKLLYDLLSNRYAGQSGIIYAFSINDTEEIASELTKKGLNVLPYNALMPNTRRTAVHTKWLSGEVQAVVATVAFGMGIDKPNVRFVIHHTMSKSMENYYQESGRAGRDGKRAECILLYRMQDLTRITGMVFTEHMGLANAYKMIEFVIDAISCRRDLISRHFSDVWSAKAECNKMCDRCYHKDKVHPPKMDIIEHCINLHRIIEHADKLDVKLTLLKLIDAWFHKGPTTLRVKEIPKPDFERFYAEQIVVYLLLKGYLKEEFHFSAYTTITYIKTGKKVSSTKDRIMFYAARVLLLPKLEDIKNGTIKEETKKEDCVYITDSDGPPAKKKKKSRSKSHEHSFSERDSDVQSLSSSIIDTNGKKKKKSKSDKKRRSESTASEIDKADDCVILVEGSDVIEID